jgi:acyl-coenzyme A synthetase/AMP-(fatty) acid ligase/acyl carrier protein
MALAHGAQLVLAKASDLLPTTGFVEMLRRLSVTIAGIPPAALSLIEHSSLPALHTLIIGGEACPVSVAECWSQGRSLFNTYGTSETTIWSTTNRCTNATDVMSIGHAITNTQTLILDNHMNLLPFGVAGELYIGGTGLSRGYLNKPWITAERFLPHPFGHRPGMRLYKTGDRARYLQDGRIELLGRLDDQIKLQGVRIELSEIESLLIEHPAVKATAVCARGEGPERILIAYVVLAAEREITVSSLRRFLTQRLPAYMVPSVFVELAHLPLTNNGKVDRNALPTSDRIRLEVNPLETASETGLQREIAVIVEDVLHLDGIGPDDDFFEHGAHSLLMVKLKGRMDTAFSCDLPMVDMFKHPTVNGLAELVGGITKSDLAAEAGITRARFRQQMRRRRQHSFS